MAAENIDTMSVQNNNSPVEATVHLLPYLKANMTDDGNLNESNEFLSVLSNNKSKDCLKRHLTDELVNSEKIKINKLVENINEEEPEDNSLKNLNQNKNTNDNFNIVMHKINEIAVSIQNKVLNEQVDDSSEAVEDNRDNASVKIICDNDKIVGKDQEVKLAIKETICKEVNEITNHTKTVNSSNDHNICFTANIPNNSQNDLNLSNSSSELNKSISDKLVIVENSDHEISQLSELLDNNNHTKTKELNTKESKVKINESEAENGLQLSMINNHEQNTSKTTIENITEVIEIDPDSNNDNVQENVEYVDNNKDDSEFIVFDNKFFDNEDNTLNEIENLNEKSLSYFFKFFEKYTRGYKYFDSYRTQEATRILTEKCGMEELPSILHYFQFKELYWYRKCMYLENEVNKKMEELKNLLDLQNKDLIIDKNDRPQICTRSVGSKACITLKESNTVQVPKLSIQQSVDIIDDDEDDIIDLDSVESSPKASTSKTTEILNRQLLPPLGIITPTPPPPNIIKTSTVLLSNIVSPRIINITNDNGTIELTQSDDNIIDITNTRNVEKSPIKIVKNQTINACNISSGTSPQLTRNLSAQAVPTSVALIEIPKLPTSSSSYAVSPGSSQLSTNLNPGSSSRAVKPVLMMDEKILPIQISPTIQTIQPAAIAYTAHQLPGSSTVTGSLLPVPPAIPIYNHPAKLPPLPAQISLPNWKKIPHSPVVSIAIKSTDNQREIVLSWNMCLNNSIADISTYQIFAYHVVDNELPRRENWKKVGEINALPLPMSCPLTQFTSDENYHFAVRAVDVHTRVGPFSEPKSLYNSI